jgi:hypothetical protein
VTFMGRSGRLCYFLAHFRKSSYKSHIQIIKYFWGEMGVKYANEYGI